MDQDHQRIAADPLSDPVHGRPQLLPAPADQDADILEAPHPDIHPCLVSLRIAGGLNIEGSKVV